MLVLPVMASVLQGEEALIVVQQVVCMMGDRG
jgi:hypothetical protein